MALNQLELNRHHELAEFLRSRRARLSPEQAGLPRGARRRTPGLRREEVAMLAGVSPEWYTRLEQGRNINVSMQLLESLARVLQLDASEYNHLFLLALRQTPTIETFAPPSVSTTLQNFLNQIGNIPACVLDPRMNVMAWNPAYCAVFGDYSTSSEKERNLLWRIFASSLIPQYNPEWKNIALIYVAHFRAEYGRFIHDPWWTNQIAELNKVSPAFQELWARHDVHNISEGKKKMYHPLVGELTFDFLWLETQDACDLRLLIHTPRPGTDTAEKIARLMA